MDRRNRPRQQGVRLTESLDVVFVEVALDVLDHQTGLADLAVTNHADLRKKYVMTVEFDPHG